MLTSAPVQTLGHPFSGSSKANSFYQQTISVLVQSTSTAGLRSSSSSLPASSIISGNASLGGVGGGGNVQSVTISISSSPSGHPAACRVLSITLTDESDPFFLFQLDIGEDEYFELKQDQNLLIDFHQFPEKFVELLDACRSGGSSTSGESSGIGKFSARMTLPSSAHSSSNAAKFSIVESNSFRNISHLTLSFVPGTDADVKRHLAMLVSEYRQLNSTLASNLQQTDTQSQQQLSAARAEVEKLRGEFEIFRMDSSARESQLRLQLSEQLGIERDRLHHEKEIVSRDAESSKSAIIARFEQKISNLSAQLEEQQRKVKELGEKLRSSESDNSQLKSRNQSLMDDLMRLRNGSSDLEHERANWLQERTKLLLDVEADKRQIDYLERSLADKQIQISRLEQSIGEKSKMEEGALKMRDKAVALEAKLKNQIEDNNKANEIIQKIQSDLKSVKAKLKAKSSTSSLQESQLEEKQASLDKLQADISDLKSQLAKRDETISSMEIVVSQLKAQSDKDKKTLEENNSVIEWLHRQLNDDAVRKPLISLPSGIPSRHNLEYKRGGGKEQSWSKFNIPTSSAALPIKQTLVKSRTESLLPITNAKEEKNALPFKSNYFK